MKRLFLTLLFIPSLLTGCGCSQDPVVPPAVEHYINVPTNTVTLTEGNEFTIPIEVIKPTIITCRSNDEEIATVTHEGLITAIKEGETTITISGGQDRFIVFVTVLAEPTKSSLSIVMPKKEFTLKVDDEFELPLTVKYGAEEVKEPVLTYVYEVEDIVSITDLTVTALAEGTTKVVVTASYDDLEVKEIFTITVYQWVLLD